MISQRIREGHEALRAQDALKYAPSLSSRVYDALFSFWRLPRGVQHRLSNALPTIQLTIDSGCARAAIDWQALATCLRSPDASAMEVAWAFALQSEAAVTASALLGPSECSALALAITHGAQLPRLAALLRDSDGEFYTAFLTLLTLLERALYDLYHDHLCSSSSPSAAAAAPPSKRKKNMILRDLLQSETLARVLPAGLLELLRILFLPSGLNLRNLAWHGFVVPAEIPKCFGCLLLVLVLALPSPSLRWSEATEEAAARAPVLFDLRSVDDRFVGRDATLCRALEALFPPASRPGSGDSRERTSPASALLDAAAATAASCFVPRGRRHLVHRAFATFAATGDELAFLFALLPVLEHALRVAFVAANGARYGLSSAYSVAQIDAYYSTLDGFGQRDKHQVLLHARVVCDDATDETSDPVGAVNALYSTLPPAALAVCLDLFMMAAGPNVRAKLCHGEADLSTLHRPNALANVSTATQLLTLAWLSLCRHCDRQQHQSPRSRSRALALSPHLTRVLDAFERSYRSSFHPFHQLERALALAHTRATELAALRTEWTHVVLDSVVSTATGATAEPMTWIAFSSVSRGTAKRGDAAKESNGAVGVLEKTRRVCEFAALLRDAALFTWRARDPTVARALADAAAPPKNSFPDLLTHLHVKLRETLEQLMQHFASVHHHRELQHDERKTASAFLSLLTARSSVLASDKAQTEQDAAQSPTEALLLALGDDDGLSVAACMLEVVASAQRAATSFSTRLRELKQLVASGRARTNHRRSLLHCAFFLPAFERVLVLCLSLVSHQVAHLKRRSMPPPCPNARDMELLQRKLLQFITAFEGCAGDTSGGSQKSQEKALLLALQFLDSKAMRLALRDHHHVDTP